MQKHPSLPFIFFFTSAVLCASGYGATFLLTEYFRSFGGNALQTGYTLAGAACGTLIGVPLIGWFSSKIHTPLPAAAGCVSQALGFFFLANLHGFSLWSPVAGFFIGLGWGAFYLAAPLTLSERTHNDDRAFWFTLYMAALFGGAGFGVVVLRELIHYLNFPVTEIFRIITVTCSLAAVFMLIFALICPGVHAAHKKNSQWVRAFIPILKTPASSAVLMIFLGACIFSSILTFQTSIGKFYGFNPDAFYITYTFVVVSSRVALAKTLGRINSALTVFCLFAFLTLGLIVSLFQAYSIFLYILSAVLLALGYGLSYPLILAHVVNGVPEKYRDPALTWGTFGYFAGIFAFPALAGYIVVTFGSAGLLFCLLGISLLMILTLFLWAFRNKKAGTPVS